jgi:DNA-binding MarR family transcriptional regulator
MEKKGFITRKKDLERKNIWRINLTSQGDIALQQSLKREAMHNVLEAANISEQELVTLRDCLVRIRNNALKQLAYKTLANIPWVAADNIELDA